MQEFGLQFKHVLLEANKEPLISGLFILLVYLLSYYANFFAFHLLFLAFVFIEGYLALGVALWAILMLAIYGCTVFAPVAPFELPNMTELDQVAVFLYKVYSSLVNDTVIQMWEVSTMAVAGILFSQTRRLNFGFEAIAFMTVLILFFIYDSDGLYLSNIASQFSVKNIELSGQTKFDFVDVAVISSLNAMSIYLYFMFWIGLRLSAWVHNAYEAYAKQASLLRLSYPYLLMMIIALVFDYQWIRILKIPVYLCFLSIVVCFFETKKFKRPEAILIALFVSFVIELLIPGFWLIEIDISFLTID
jgi:hypothetical protein